MESSGEQSFWILESLPDGFQTHQEEHLKLILEHFCHSLSTNHEPRLRHSLRLLSSFLNDDRYQLPKRERLVFIDGLIFLGFG